MIHAIATHNVLTTSPFKNDAVFIRQSSKPDSEKVMEFGARVCYRSVARTGDAANLVKTCMREEHYDIAEHGHAVFLLQHYPEVWRAFKYLNTYEYQQHLFVGGNLRAWYDVLKDIRPMYPTLVKKLETELSFIAPSLFDKTIDDYHHTTAIGVRPTVLQVEHGQYVQMLAVSKDIFTDKPMSLKLNHATFYIDHRSRLMCNQLVRHRTMSFSQASQRYIDRKKGEWELVIPPSIQCKPHLLSKVLEFENTASDLYDYLRENGIRREDARYILPGGMESSIVVSGVFEDWEHFLHQRTAPGAQWEIRDNVADDIQRMLNQVAPHVFSYEQRTTP